MDKKTAKRIEAWRSEQLKAVPEFDCTDKISSIFKYCARQYDDIPLEMEVYNLLPLFLGWDPAPLPFNNATALLNIELCFDAYEKLAIQESAEDAMKIIQEFGIGHVEIPGVLTQRIWLRWELDLTEDAKRRCDFFPEYLRRTGNWLHPSVFETKNRPRIELDFFEYEPDSRGPVAAVSGVPPKFTSIDLRGNDTAMDITFNPWQLHS